MAVESRSDSGDIVTLYPVNFEIPGLIAIATNAKGLALAAITPR
jgi:hypothetical protein